MGLVEIKKAREDLEAAKKILEEQSKSSIKEELERLFHEDPTINAIQWSQKDSEYDDEGMYPGVFGPYFVMDSDDEDANGYGRFPRELYGYDSSPIPPELQKLQEILSCLGSEILSSLFGDANVSTATFDGRSVSIESEYTD